MRDAWYVKCLRAQFEIERSRMSSLRAWKALPALRVRLGLSYELDSICPLAGWADVAGLPRGLPRLHDPGREPVGAGGESSGHLRRAEQRCDPLRAQSV